MDSKWDEFRAGSRVRPSEEVEKLAYESIGAAIEVHRILGPGHLESAYRDAMCIELELRGIPVEREVTYDLQYKGRPIGKGRIDLLVAGKLISELKACEGFARVHTAQAISYLRCMNQFPRGLDQLQRRTAPGRHQARRLLTSFVASFASSRLCGAFRLHSAGSIVTTRPFDVNCS